MKYIEIKKSLFKTIGIEIFLEREAKFLTIDFYRYILYIGRNIGTDGMNRGRI